MTDEWRKEVLSHLTTIEANAEACQRAAMRLVSRPDYETRAEIELDLCAMTLRTALGRIERALARVKGEETKR